MSLERLAAKKRQKDIETLKVFARKAYTTQVLMPSDEYSDMVYNRLTHAYIVKSSSDIISSYIGLSGLNIDYKFSLGNVCLVHDIGHSPFGHDGAKVLDKRFKELGVKEGFSDNNNNFKVLLKNGGTNILSDYELASIVKYPNSLYPDQYQYLKRLLKSAIDEDIYYFESKGVKIFNRPERTIACNIMDEADRNSYVSYDLSDCYTLEIADENSIGKLIDQNIFYDSSIKEILFTLYSSIKSKDKTLIRHSFNRLNDMFNENYYIGDSIELTPKNQEIIVLREKLFQIEMDIFIKSDYVNKQNRENRSFLRKYIDYVVENHIYTSKTYQRMIENESDSENILRLYRDMIAEATDAYVIQFIKKNNL
jgi:dGTP triphosphohydrolase